VTLVTWHGLLAECIPAHVRLESSEQEVLGVEAGHRGSSVDPDESPLRVVLRGLNLGQKRPGRVVLEVHGDPCRLLERSHLDLVVTLRGVDDEWNRRRVWTRRVRDASLS